jgi:hypothetical protein
MQQQRPELYAQMKWYLRGGKAVQIGFETFRGIEQWLVEDFLGLGHGVGRNPRFPVKSAGASGRNHASAKKCCHADKFPVSFLP